MIVIFLGPYLSALKYNCMLKAKPNICQMW